jgi:hypothetical protein
MHTVLFSGSTAGRNAPAIRKGFAQGFNNPAAPAALRIMEEGVW